MLNNYDSLCAHVHAIANVSFFIVCGKVCITINSLYVNVGKHAYSTCNVDGLRVIQEVYVNAGWHHVHRAQSVNRNDILKSMLLLCVKCI